MMEITITILDSTNMKSRAGVSNLYLLTSNDDCLMRAFFQANSQGWLPRPVKQNQISVRTSLSIYNVKEEVQSWFNPDVVKVNIK